MYFFISGIRLLGNFFLYDLLLGVSIRNTLYHVCTGFAATCFFLLQGLWVIVVLGKNLQKNAIFQCWKIAVCLKRKLNFFPQLAKACALNYWILLMKSAYWYFFFSSLFMCVCAIILLCCKFQPSKNMANICQK